MLFDMSKRLRRFWQRARGVIDIFHLLPPVAAILIFRLLTDVPQTREIYLSYIEHPEPWQIGWAILGFSLISAALYGSHYWLSRIRINIIYATYLHPNTGLNFRRVRRCFGAVWSATPWAGLAVGLYVLRDNMYTNQGLLRQAATGDPTKLTAELNELLTVMVYGLFEAFIVVIVVGAVVTALLHFSRRSRVVPWILIATIAVLMVAAALIPWLGATVLPWDAIQVYRWIGPLGTMALAILFILSLFIALALLSQRSGFPALTLVLLVIGIAALVKIPLDRMSEVLFWVCLALIVLAAVSGLWWVALVTALLAGLAVSTWIREAKQDELIAATSSLPATFGVQQRFAEWLSHRPDGPPDAAAGGKKYPVFIVAVEGGGIYAAAAASLFLARLQDRCPSFAHHVFAISGVSGGSVGATVFQAFARPSEQSATSSTLPKCGSDRMTPLTDQISPVMLADHFSPLVGSIIPDFLGEESGRARELENSFLESVGLPDSPATQALTKQYAAYTKEWAEGGVGPALVLNTTWADNGLRVAFAPFTLEKSTGGSLYSFADSEMPGENISLMHAALVSARFPGVLPPYSVLMPGSGHRWSFVDGGYADSSGATTALDLFRAIGPGNPDHQKQNVDIKIILLTSADPEPDFKNIDGTPFRDTIAPIDAIMNVRYGLGNQAVARVCDFFQIPLMSCKNRDRADRKSALHIVQLQDQAYSLPLGWKLSKVTFDLVSLLIGNPDPCPSSNAPETNSSQPEGKPANPQIDGDASKKNEGPNRQISMSNSCVLRSIEETLTAWAG